MSLHLFLISYYLDESSWGSTNFWRQSVRIFSHLCGLRYVRIYLFPVKKECIALVFMFWWLWSRMYQDLSRCDYVYESGYGFFLLLFLQTPSKVYCIHVGQVWLLQLPAYILPMLCVQKCVVVNVFSWWSMSISACCLFWWHSFESL